MLYRNFKVWKFNLSKLWKLYPYFKRPDKTTKHRFHSPIGQFKGNIIRDEICVNSRDSSLNF